MCVKYMKGMFSPECLAAQLFLDTLAVYFTEKERNRWRNFFSGSGNAICSILLKYQEIYVQIETVTDEN